MSVLKTFGTVSILGYTYIIYFLLLGSAMARQFFILTACGVIMFNAFSAGPFMHIYLAQEWLKTRKSYNNYESQLFLLGTLFPDIRYLGNIERSKTHEYPVTLDMIRDCKDAFKAGALFHAFVDEVREDFVEHNCMYNMLKDAPESNKTTLLKLIEDEIVYDRINSSDIIKLLQTVAGEERAYAQNLNIKDSDLEIWHRYLISFFKAGSIKTVKGLCIERKSYLGVTVDTLEAWNGLLPLLVQDSGLRGKVQEMINLFITKFN
jgi:hypothetical protein